MDILDGSNLRVNIVGADSSVILDGFNRTVMANIVSSNGNLLVDHDMETFHGDLKGNVRGPFNIVMVNTVDSHISANTIFGNIVDQDFNIVYDSVKQTLNASVIGDLYNSKGEQVSDIEKKIWFGDVQGSIFDSTGTLVFDHDINAIKKDIVGNLFTDSGKLSFDFTTGVFYGEFKGQFVGHDDETVYDSETGRFKGDLVGDIFGNIRNSNNEIFIDTEKQTVSKLTGELYGSFFGDIFRSTGETFYDSGRDLVNADTGKFNNIIGNLEGDVVGNIIDPLNGDIILDVYMKSIYADLIGEIWDSSGKQVFDPDLSIIRINNLYTSEVTSDIYTVPNSVYINQNGIKIESDKVFSEPSIELRYFRDFEPPIPNWFQIGLELCMAGGTQTDPEPVKAGQKLPGIVFSAALEVGNTGEDSSVMLGTDDFKTKTYVSAIYAQIPEDAEFRPDLKEAGLPGDLIFVTGGYAEDIHYMKFDCTGKLHATLAELDVDGETGVIPNNVETPDSWLQVKVNGETKFIKLYS